MNRKMEKILVRIGAIWNIFTGSMTLFYYRSWLEQNVLIEQITDDASLFIERFYHQHIQTFVMVYGMIFILIGVIHFYLSNQFDKQKHVTSHKIPIWLFMWSLISFFTVDVIGVLLYLPAAGVYLLKTRAIKMKLSGSMIDDLGV